ncbi:hypothetical protein ODJ79_40800 [Actinoplanes sp. KI2]|nr:sigma factor [Actinoplanes sp. KI2]MCU7730093.1 hypothetical protein [Actinoplanes sp. KI2]
MRSRSVQHSSGPTRARNEACQAPAPARASPTRRITCSRVAGPPVPQAVAEFESNRSRLFGIAYRMLGRAADAEDVV